jgi:L-rhamnose isomerase
MTYHEPDEKMIKTAYEAARTAYAALDVDTDAAVARALAVPLSLHCWQADDIAGLERKEKAVSGGGIMATGNYPGRARDAGELRADYEKVLSLLPGKHRLNIHACYLETEGADRDAVQPRHMDGWIAWARQQGVALDFNTTFFAHPLADSGYTLSSADEHVRQFWVKHGVACRRIAEHIARELNTPCVLNHWIPDGAKDSPADRWSPRARLVRSLDEMLDDAHGIDTTLCRDAVESKLFGLGSEDYVVGSAEFYNSYALKKGVLYCLDMGHFHPTETIHDKLSAYLQFHQALLLHVSRPIRWDSDHVVLFNDDLRAVFLELVRGNALDRALVAMDFFDASINRIAAYVIGARATRKAMLYALLDPSGQLRAMESAGQGAHKLAWMEEVKTLPFGAVWDYACHQAGVPVGAGWLRDVDAYEARVLSARG